MVAMVKPGRFRPRPSELHAVQFREGDLATQEHVSFGYPTEDRADLKGKHWVSVGAEIVVLTDGDWIVLFCIPEVTKVQRVMSDWDFHVAFEPVEKPVGGSNGYVIDMRDVILRATKDTDASLVRAAVHEVCTYHSPTGDMPARFAAVSKAIEDACVVLIENCPPSGDRTAAIRQLLDARMVANRSISLAGAF